MSSYMVDDEHVHVLLAWALDNSTAGGALMWEVGPDASGPGITVYGPTDRIRRLTRESAGTVGQVLIEANSRAVDERYREDDNVRAYTYRRPRTAMWSPVEILKACRGLAYQCSDWSGWRDSEARAALAAIRDLAIALLPGMEDAESWDITPDTPTLEEVEEQERRWSRRA